MIRLIENNLTKNKHVVNFMDHFGRVLGFKPEPDGFPISWRLYDEHLNEYCNEEDCKKFLPDFLKNLPYTFGDYIVTKSEKDLDVNLEELNIHLIPDNPEDKAMVLIAEFFAQGFYTAEFSLDPLDKEALNGNNYCHIQSSTENRITTLFKEYDETFSEIKEKVAKLDHIQHELKNIFATIQNTKG